MKDAAARRQASGDPDWADFAWQQYDYVELTREVISEDDSVPKFSSDHAPGSVGRGAAVEVAVEK